MVFEQLAQRGLLSSFFEQLLVQHLKKHGRCQVLGVVQATEWCCPPKLAHFYSTLAGVRVKLRIESSMLEVFLEVKLKVMSRFQAPGLLPEVVCMCLCRSLCPIRRDRLEQLASMVGGGVFGQACVYALEEYISCWPKPM